MDKARRCSDWVRRSLLEACSLPAERRSEALHTVALRLSLVRPLMEEYAAFQQARYRLAPSSTSLAEMVRYLRYFEVDIPTVSSTGAEIEAAVQEATRPTSLSGGLTWEVQVLGVRATPLGIRCLHVGLQSGGNNWTLHVWGVSLIDGLWKLSQASLQELPDAVLFVGCEGQLKLRGDCVLVPSASEHSRESPGLGVAPQSLLNRVNSRARWDYELEGSGADLALRGSSGHYDPGSQLQMLQVLATRLAGDFSHAVFCLLRPHQLPLELRPPGYEGLALGIESEAGSSSSHSQVVVCRGLGFVDEDGPMETACLDLQPVTRSRQRLPLTVEAGQLWALLPDQTPEGRALSATRPYWTEAPAHSTSTSASVLARELLRSLESRVSIELECLFDPLVCLARQEAQMREAYDLLEAAATIGAPNPEALRDDLWMVGQGEPSQRLLEEARGALVREVSRREMGLTPQPIELNLDHLTVGRVFSDPPLEAHLPEAEKLARAAELVVLGDQGSFSLAELLPDPQQRARVLSMAGSTRRRLGALEPAAHYLARKGWVDVAELSFLLDNDPALHWYVVLRALLLGHPAFAGA